MDGAWVVVWGSLAVTAGLPLLGWTLLAARASDRTGAPADARRVRLDQGIAARLLRPAVASLGKRARRLTPAGRIERLERRVRLLGGSSAWTVERAFAAKLGLAIVGLFAGVVFADGNLLGRPLFITAVLTVGGFYTPDLLLWGRAKERQQLIQRALPDTLDQLTICVESGLGFDAALRRVGGRGHGPLADELRRTLNEIAVGVPRADALTNLTERTDVPELRSFVLAVRQADGYGLPIARVLRIQASQLRVKRRQTAEERALKMPVKITFPLVVCIFPSLFIILLGPAVLRVARAIM